MSRSSTSSVVMPSKRSILRNSFIPLIKRLHSKSVSFSLVFLLNIKMTSLYLVTPFYKEVCVLSNVWIIKINYKSNCCENLHLLLLIKFFVKFLLFVAQPHRLLLKRHSSYALFLIYHPKYQFRVCMLIDVSS